MVLLVTPSCSPPLGPENRHEYHPSDDDSSRRAAPGHPRGHPKSIQKWIGNLIGKKSNFESHVGSMLDQFWCNLRNQILQWCSRCDSQWIFIVSDVDFEIILDFENRSRRPSDAKRSTFDFERQDYENHTFWLWVVARRLPKSFPGGLPKRKAFSLQFRCQKYTQNNSKMESKLTWKLRINDLHVKITN